MTSMGLADPCEISAPMRRRLPACDEKLDPTAQLLSRMLLRSAAPLLVTLLPACGDDIPSYSGRPHCIEDRWVPTSNLDLPQQVAYASLRWRLGGEAEILSASGVPCGDASDIRLCEAELERVSIRETEADGKNFLLTTDRDLVEAFQTLREKLTLLGAIDTPDEALLIADHEGLFVQCDTEVGREGSGYGVVFKNQGCNGRKRIYYRVSEEGSLQLQKNEAAHDGDCGVVPGRRPPGLCDIRQRVNGHHALARYFARAARLEAASVEAFTIVERELVANGLPRAMRDALREAAHDEVRHAHDTGRLAERYGSRAHAMKMSRTSARSLAEIAADNAIEGCVGESYAAFIAHIQASHARDPELRRVLTSIAHEETRHAALSWQLADWLEPQLDPATRTRIGATRRRAIARMGTHV